MARDSPVGPDRHSMNFPTVALALIIGFASSWALTIAIRRFAIASQMVDHPNERSSHSVPTPRGGGVAIVVSFAALLIALRALDAISGRFFAAALGGGVLVAMLGFADDRAHLPARWRFLGHAIAAVWTLWWLGPMPAVPLFGTPVVLGFAGLAVAGCFIVWSVNLFNFMDGIDGIASVEAITCATSGALLWCLSGIGPDWVAALALTAAVAGFLIWNFPPAKIFMGDAGSGFLGFTVAFFSLWCGYSAPQLFWSWFILFGCFMVDGTTTLVRRVRRGDKFYVAHRSHAYQYAARRLGSHRRVTLIVGAINLLWLLPIAALVAFAKVDGTAAAVVAYAPLVALAFYLKAGDRAGQAAAG
jgi:Fuc2NAc and GlcNAc transferase